MIEKEKECKDVGKGRRAGLSDMGPLDWRDGVWGVMGFFLRVKMRIGMGIGCLK